MAEIDLGKIGYPLKNDATTETPGEFALDAAMAKKLNDKIDALNLSFANQGKIGVTTLGTVNGVTFQYYKKGNIITISSYGILDANIGGWNYLEVPSLLPVKLRPLIDVNATWSASSRPFRMNVKPDGKVSIQNSNDGPGGIGLNIPLSVSYAVDW